MDDVCAYVVYTGVYSARALPGTLRRVAVIVRKLTRTCLDSLGRWWCVRYILFIFIVVRRQVGAHDLGEKNQSYVFKNLLSRLFRCVCARALVCHYGVGSD